MMQIQNTNSRNLNDAIMQKLDHLTIYLIERAISERLIFSKKFHDNRNCK